MYKYFKIDSMLKCHQNSHEHIRPNCQIGRQHLLTAANRRNREKQEEEEEMEKKLSKLSNNGVSLNTGIV